jgi:hypothetical protein
VISATAWLIHRNRQTSQCRERRNATIAQVERLSRDARKQIRPGTTKDKITQFFATQGITLQFTQTGDHQEANGVLELPPVPECGVSKCTTGPAQVRIAVTLDASGNALDTPFVVARGINCM